MSDFGIWTDHRIPEDRSAWHPAIRRVYDHWLGLAPASRLPGRQHIAPEDLTQFLPRLFLVDVCRTPLRFRYRLIGTEVVWSRRSNATGQWLDEVHPPCPIKPILDDRYRFMARTGLPTWRRGDSVWDREPNHYTVENCLMPLAGDGKTVDMVFGISVVFDPRGVELRQ